MLRIADENPQGAYRVRIEPPYGNDAILSELAQVQSSIALLREKIAELEKRAAELIASLPRG